MSLIRKHGAVLQAWACLALVMSCSGMSWYTRNILDCGQKTPDRHKDLGDISHTTCVIANFDPKFVAMATRVGRGGIWLTSLNSPTPKTPC